MLTAVGGAILIGLGVYLLWRPGTVVNKLQEFYEDYPLMRYAGKDQLRSRNGVVVGLGIIFVGLGLFLFVWTVS